MSCLIEGQALRLASMPARPSVLRMSRPSSSRFLPLSTPKWLRTWTWAEKFKRVLTCFTSVRKNIFAKTLKLLMSKGWRSLEESRRLIIFTSSSKRFTTARHLVPSAVLSVWCILIGWLPLRDYPCTQLIGGLLFCARCLSRRRCGMIGISAILILRTSIRSSRQKRLIIWSRSF